MTTDNLPRAQLAILFCCLMAISMGQSLVFAILPPLGREVAMSELQITSIVASSALFFALTAPHWGRLSDRVGRKPIILTGLIGYTLGTMVFVGVFQAGLSGLLVGGALYFTALGARLCQAVIMSAASPATGAYAADHSSVKHRMKALAKLGTANNLGTIIGPGVCALLVSLGLLAPLYFAACLTGLAALLCWKKLPESRVELISHSSSRKRLSYFDTRYSRYLLAAIGMFMGFASLQQTLGFSLQDTLGLSGVETAQMAGAALMISAIFAFFSQIVLVQRLNITPDRFLEFGMVFALIGASIISTFDRFSTLAIGMAFLGSGMGMVMPSAAAGASMAVSQEEQGVVAGLISSCPAMGFVAGPLIGGMLYQVQGQLASIFGAFVFLVVLVCLRLTRSDE
jgi:MFS family permease